MIKNIIFDMGGVLIEWNPYLFCERLGVTNRNDQDILVNATSKSQKWHDADQGLITMDEMERYSLSYVPDRLKKDCHRLVRRWFEVSFPIEGMEEMMRELKRKGYGIYLLSNASYNQPFYFRHYPYNDLFDGKIVSCFYKVNKPDERIYQILTDRYHLKKEECVFIDDRKRNVEASNEFGIRAFLFENAEKLKIDLKSIDVEI